MKNKIGMGFYVGTKPTARAILDSSYKFRQRTGHWPEWIEVHPDRLDEAKAAAPEATVKAGRCVSAMYIFLWRGEG